MDLLKDLSTYLQRMESEETPYNKNDYYILLTRCYVEIRKLHFTNRSLRDQLSAAQEQSIIKTI